MTPRDPSNLSDTKLTQIVITPFRLVDLLEVHGGDFMLRATEHGGRYQVATIHLYRHELFKLGEIIQFIRGEDEPATKPALDFYFVERGKQCGAECSACGDYFTDSKGRKGNDCIPKCANHAAEKHQHYRLNFCRKPATGA